MNELNLNFVSYLHYFAPMKLLLHYEKSMKEKNAE